MNRRYFDWAASAPLAFPAPAAVPAGNPSSRHAEGREARRLLEGARSRCAAVLGVPPSTLYFTSGGTEGNALVLHSLLLRQGDPALIHSAVEHPSVAANGEALRRAGRRVGIAPVLPDGRADAEGVLRCLDRTANARMAALMAVNNETGAVSDISAIAAAMRLRSGPPVHLHCDAVQALGKIPFDLGGSGIDSASFSMHKLGGPRGIGLLYLRRSIEPLVRGGGQEGGIRPGTENVAGALAAADCLERLCPQEAVRERQAAAEQRWARLIAAVRDIPGAVIIPADRGEQDERFSPYILQAAFRGIPAEPAVRALDDLGFAVSTGSACSSGRSKRPVLEAMGVDEDTAFRALRFSQGWNTTEDDVEALIAALRSLAGGL